MRMKMEPKVSTKRKRERERERREGKKDSLVQYTPIGWGFKYLPKPYYIVVTLECIDSEITKREQNIHKFELSPFIRLKSLDTWDTTKNDNK